MIIIQLRIQYNEQNVQSGSEQNVQNLVLNNSSKLLTGSFPSFSLWCWLEASTISLTVWGQSWQWKTALKIKCVILKKTWTIKQIFGTEKNSHWKMKHRWKCISFNFDYFFNAIFRFFLYVCLFSVTGFLWCQYYCQWHWFSEWTAESSPMLDKDIRFSSLNKREDSVFQNVDLFCENHNMIYSMVH